MLPRVLREVKEKIEIQIITMKKLMNGPFNRCHFVNWLLTNKQPHGLVATCRKDSLFGVICLPLLTGKRAPFFVISWSGQSYNQNYLE